MRIRPILFSAGCIALISTATMAQIPSVLVCRAKQCAEASTTMSREYLFNQLAKLMDKNIGKEILLCEADPTTHVCLQNGLSFPAQSSMIQTTVSIPKAQLVDSKILPNATGLDLVLDYKIKAGDTFPRCQTALSRLGVASANAVQMMSPQFNCRLTETGNTVLSIVYNIDYVDFDYGTLGAHYSAASGQALPGGKTGYLLMRFTQASPLTTTDTFPMNSMGQQAQDAGQMHTQMEAIWMKPTPFLNLETPVFMPEGCLNNMENCSAEVLNTAQSIPMIPTVQPTPLPVSEGVASTTGLIEQTKTLLPPSKGMTQTVITRKQVSEEGKPVYVEEEVRRFVQESPDSPLVEDTAAAKKTASGTNPTMEDVTTTETTPTTEIPTVTPSATPMDDQGNAPTPSATPMDDQGNAPTPSATPMDDQNSAPTPSAAPIAAPTIAQPSLPVQPPQPNVLMVPQMPTPAVLPQGTYNGNTPSVEIITPEGLTLTAQEQAYIQQLPLPPEAMNIGMPPQVDFGNMPDTSRASQEVIIENAAVAPVLAAQQTAPIIQPTPTPQTTLDQKPAPQVSDPEKEKQTSLWDKVEKYIYF